MEMNDLSAVLDAVTSVGLRVARRVVEARGVPRRGRVEADAGRPQRRRPPAELAKLLHTCIQFKVLRNFTLKEYSVVSKNSPDKMQLQESAVVMHSPAYLRRIPCHVNQMTFDAPNQNNLLSPPFFVGHNDNFSGRTGTDLNYRVRLGSKTGEVWRPVEVAAMMSSSSSGVD